MKRFIVTGIMAIAWLAGSMSAGHADDKKRDKRYRRENQVQNSNRGFLNTQGQFSQGQLLNGSHPQIVDNVIDKLRKKHQQKHDAQQPTVPLDPGRGDGQVGTGSTNTPPSRPGFVWVNDHWERVKAEPQGLGVGGQTGATQGVPQGNVEAWNTPPLASAGGGVTVTTPKPFNGRGTIRDHRKDRPANGGVTVSGRVRNPNVMGEGGSPIDAVVDLVVIEIEGEVNPLYLPNVDRDHRDDK